MTSLRRSLPFVLVLLLLAPVVALATTARFDLDSPSGGPFPSDVFTVADPSQNTSVRVSLPKPDCAARPSDCADIDVLNTLDGFNTQPRISIPFNGPIDPTSVSSANVFLVSLGSTLGGRGGKVVGINQIVWEPAANTLHVESDELLDQHTRYALVVTRGVRDAARNPLAAGDFARFRHDLNFGQTKNPVLKAYRKALLDALEVVSVRESDIAVMSVFSTQSVTSTLEKIRASIKLSHPAPATIHGTFPLATLTAIQWQRQVGTAPVFASSFLPTPALSPTVVSAIALGQFTSPDYETPERFIPPVGTLLGLPRPQGENTLQFQLVLPAGPPPAGGWPVVIFGHGFGDSKHGAPFAVASTLAAHGLASIAINVVGHGGGALGTLTVLRTNGPPVTFPDGGRGIDQDGNGRIDSTEGSSAAPPRDLIGNRDGLRQTVVDLMQLVRVIETGGIPGLDRHRIYYAGQSFGAIYGTMFLAVEPSVRAGVPNVPGGSIIEVARLGVFRGLVAVSLLLRVPALSNTGPTFYPILLPIVPGGTIPGFDENIPLRNEAVRIDTVPGASAIQVVLDNTEWASMSGNPVAYAPYIRKSPLPGVPPKSVIVQFARGDQTVPNPTATAILRAGDLADRATYFRNDLFIAANSSLPPAVLDPLKNAHTFLTRITGPASGIALAGQAQMAIFFEHDGNLVVDPDGTGVFFETPITPPLPETLNFIP